MFFMKEVKFNMLFFVWDGCVHYFGLVGGFEPPPIQRVGIPSITSRRF